ncbi:MAG: UDP-N-acetylmuramate--L-alanine ligase [Clostridiales Family XIII bacterium]|jgi:UDP-N-acetylmuramate--alanine ligase|nr:UDP-N-acetylmuramate--L-alanine ligase [Clostridiales Family XIII bacterium]
MIDLSNVKHVHCIGIGGIGLSAVAEVLFNEGYAVTGSDMHESEITARLIEKGIPVFLGHRERNIGDADLVVYSSAVASANPELAEAEARGVPVVSRAQILGQLMERKKYSVAVAGTHGKTTTTSMIALVLKDSDRDPTILVGGNLSEIGGNVRLGESEYFVTEACEYMDSFLNLAARYAVILNIDSDHLDYFDDIYHIARSFKRFARLVPEDGVVVAFDANPFVSNVLRDLDRRIITFGFHDHCDYSARDIEFGEAGMPAFSIVHGGETIARIELIVPGEHNISNALAAFACCHDMGVGASDIVRTLESFKGTQRRFDVLGKTMGGIRIVDDYAHHPTEIAATIRAARNIPCKSLWILFQPHTYTRTLALQDEFAEALSLADKIVMAEIYAAREKNIHRISSKTIVSEIKERDPKKEAYYFNEFEQIAGFVLNNAEEGDLIITMGAGDINRVGEMILRIDRDSYMK